MIHQSKNNKGPNIEPYGTPQSIERRSVFSSLLDTFLSVLDKYDLNQLKAVPQTPLEISCLTRILRCTQSNAFEK